ncbi:alpha-L-fucosidase 1 [Impatiens glandulifera]|uniref:alpha-L-fucosidase 1 n=1 Tax=Impatiens glandulifera TaxID=253017 RepID=UPI001FB0973C|nr:alpha-L-fucosidase 1 [Impatiens glandulifera]
MMFNLLLLTLSVSSYSIPSAVRPPIPILPIPTSSQLSWQLSEMSIFLHFGINTFTDSEWGTGKADPSIFNPSALDAAQWVRVAKENGFGSVILTTKHHDGFCLWPSDYTDYSVKTSPWKDGNGDIVAELAAAAKDAGVQMGLYLSPWDRHEPDFGKTLEYNEYYMGQMAELLTRYGEVTYVFLDGAKGDDKKMEYFFQNWFARIHQLQPGAVIFSDSGPDVRWVGNEYGVAGTTCWSTFNTTAVMIGGDNDPKYAEGGDAFGLDWVPAECDVSIRPGWFWHKHESPKTAETLLDLYYESVGRNCHFLLNIPPNKSGLISDEDITVLQEFTQLRKSIFSNNLAKNAAISSSSTRGGKGGSGSASRFSPESALLEEISTYWAPEEKQHEWVLFLDFQEEVTFNVLQVKEPIQMGQRVYGFHLDSLDKNGQWKQVTYGTTVGYQRLLRFPLTKATSLRLVVTSSRADPLISYLGIYFDKVWSAKSGKSSSPPHFNGSHILHQTVYNHSTLVASV